MKCPECKSSHFVDEESLQRHVLEFHKKTLSEHIQYQCSGCKKSYSAYSSLRKHLQTCFLQESPLPVSGPSSSYHSERPSGLISLDNIDDFVPVTDQGISDDEVEKRPSKHLRMDPDESASDDETLLEGTSQSVEELLQEEAVKFLIHIKENCTVTQRAINEIVSGVDHLQEIILQVIEKHIQTAFGGAADVVKTSDVLKEIRGLKGFSIFEGVRQKNDALTYLHQSGGLVDPVKVVFRKEQEIRKGKVHTVDVDFGYYIPFLPQLERLLNCSQVLQCVDNPRTADPAMCKTVLDGSIYRSHPVYLKDVRALAIIMYHDGIEIVDPLSSRTKKHHMTNFYWNLGNIYPEFRSTDRTVNLLATVNTNDLKAYGYKIILKDFLDGINKLSTDGVIMNINGKKRTFHGMLLCVTGDTPASGAIAGFKESVSAEKPCRHCLASSASEFLKIPDIKKFQRRDKASHEKHLAEIEAYSKLTTREKEVRPDPSVMYGVNSRSHLMDLIYFDVTKQMPQDLMHVGNEGCLELMCRLLIKNVLAKSNLSLDTINLRISEFSKYLVKDKPSEIQPSHLHNSLRQSAAQMRSLSVLLPFVLRKQNSDSSTVFGGDDEYLDCFLFLLRAMNLAMAYEFHVEDPTRLRKLAQKFHEKLLHLEPHVTMVKVHLFHHLVELIAEMGSIRQVTCFRFEAHHAFFKRLARIMHNFVNPCLSLATRHQSKQCRLLMNANFLDEGCQFTKKKEVTGMLDRNVTLIKEAFPSLSQLFEVSMLKMNDATFKKDKVVLLSSDPVKFAIVQKVYIVDCVHFCLLCRNMSTKSLDRRLNAFEVLPDTSMVVLNIQQLTFPHDIISLKVEGKSYVIPLGHRAILT